MIQRSQSIICMCALMLVGTRATAQIPAAEDFQQWTTVAAAWQVKPKLAISTFGEVHLGNDVSQFDQELASAGVIYPLSRWVSLGTGYLYLHANPKLSGISSENRFVDRTFQDDSISISLCERRSGGCLLPSQFRSHSVREPESMKCWSVECDLAVDPVFRIQSAEFWVRMKVKISRTKRDPP